MPMAAFIRLVKVVKSTSRFVVELPPGTRSCWVAGGVRVLHDWLDLIRRLYIFHANGGVRQIGEGGKINVQIRGRTAAGNQELLGCRWRPEGQRSQITQLVEGLGGVKHANQILPRRGYLPE